MRKMLPIAIVLAASLATPVLAQLPAAAAPTSQPTADSANVTIPVHLVKLYSSGVGYFEHDGTVTGDGTAKISFTTDQFNDVLKSLVLQDLSGGKVDAVTYQSQDPLSKTLSTFGIDLSQNPSLAQLLEQLRGASVTAIAGGETIHGTILSLQQRRKIVGGGAPNQIVDTAELTLVADGTLRTFSLDDVTSLTLDDPALQRQLTAALAAIAQSRDKQKRPVTIRFSGTGERHVRIGYVVEAPVWRASYRLILPDATAPNAGDDKSKPAQADLQGWAIVENPTDTDWNHVQLSLVSGRPISFTEDLDTPLYLARPVVQPQQYAGLQPPTYEQGMAPGVAGKLMQQQASARSMFSAANMQNNNAQNNAPSALPEAVQSAPMDATASIAAMASGADLGELFQYTVPDVTLLAHQASMIPIVTNTIDAQRVSVYNTSVLPRHPLNGALLKNNTGKYLLAGPVTVIEGSAYAGDAQLDNLPPGQHRLISYGIDLKMVIDAADTKDQSDVIAGKINKGVLTVTTRDVITQHYKAENKSDRDKRLIIEHPRRAGYSLTNTAAPMETTDNLYRFSVEVPASKTASLDVAEEQVTGQEIALLPADIDTFALYRTTGAIPKPVQDALAKAMQMKQDIAATQSQIEQIKASLAEITAEQRRIREDLGVASSTSDYHNRLMKKLDAQETQIEQLQQQRDDLQKKLNQQQAALSDYLNTLDVG